MNDPKLQTGNVNETMLFNVHFARRLNPQCRSHILFLLPSSSLFVAALTVAAS